MGLLAAAILEANNIRDIETDAEANKRTLAVMIGRKNARRLFSATLIASGLVVLFGSLLGLLPPMCLIALVVAPLGIPLVQTVNSATTGPELIAVLKGTALLQFLAALMLSLGIVL